LKKQIEERLFDRASLNRDYKSVLAITDPKEVSDIIVDPYVLSFLGLPNGDIPTESELSQHLVRNIEIFLRSLGKGFAFVGREEPFDLDGKTYFVDLVFYNIILKCYVLIELKRHEVTHKDLGQIGFYVNHYDNIHVKKGANNPTVGLVLTTKKSVGMVNTALQDRPNIFCSEYVFSEEELDRKLSGLSEDDLSKSKEIFFAKIRNKLQKVLEEDSTLRKGLFLLDK
jgi:predicted nuclease of restriction endonuclease-like (RecB) superfamily